MRIEIEHRHSIEVAIRALKIYAMRNHTFAAQAEKRDTFSEAARDLAAHCR